jgi:hypothetical protein
LIATFQSADCHLSIRLIATFQFGWLPHFVQFGLSAT